MQRHEEWLFFAEEDLKVAQILLNSDQVSLGPVLFHIQQACEKSLKAYLISKKQAPKRTHDLVALLDQCKNFNDIFCQLEADVFSLNPYYMGTRYPDTAFSMPDIATAHVSIQQARRVIQFVKDVWN